MNFLAPLFLIGALAVAAPIIFHFIRRNPKERIFWGSNLFLEATLPKVTTKKKIENWLLLIFRCLILLLLAFGFSRPFLANKSLPSAAAPAGKKIIFLLDQSASMQREGLWPQLVSRTVDRIESLNPQDQFAVYLFDSSATPLMNFAESKVLGFPENRNVILAKIRELKPGFQLGNIGEVLTLATQELKEFNFTEAIPGEVVLISDLQESMKLSALQQQAWPANTRLIIDKLTPKNAANASIQLVSSSENLFQGNTDTQIKVKVLNSKASSATRFTLDSGVSNTSVYAAAGAQQNSTLPVPPDGKIKLAGDAEPFDNTLYVAPRGKADLRVLYIGSDNPDLPETDLFFLRKAFLQASNSLIQMTQVTGNALTPAALEKTPTLIVAADPLSSAQIQQLRGAVERGSVLCLLPRGDLMLPLVQAFFPGIQQIEVKNGDYLLEKLDLKDSLLAPFAEPRFSDFTKIHVWKYHDLVGSHEGIKVVARLEGGAPGILRTNAGSGLVFAITFGWNPGESQLGLSSKFIPLVYSLLEQNRELVQPGSQYFIGENLPLKKFNQSTIERPDGKTDRAENAAAYGKLDVPGIYLIKSQGETQRVAVNLHPAESKSETFTEDDFSALGIKIGAPVAAAVSVAAAANDPGKLEGQQRLWRWAVVGVIGFLLLEVFTAILVGRREQRS